MPFLSVEIDHLHFWWKYLLYLMFPIVHHGIPGHRSCDAWHCDKMLLHKDFLPEQQECFLSPPHCLLEPQGWPLAHFAIFCSSHSLKPFVRPQFYNEFTTKLSLVRCSLLGCDREWNLVHSRITIIIELDSSEGTQMSCRYSHTSFPVLCHLHSEQSQHPLLLSSSLHLLTQFNFPICIFTLPHASYWS